MFTQQISQQWAKDAKTFILSTSSFLFVFFKARSAITLTLFGSVFRYPVILNRFHLNLGTGGKGLCNGGDGVVRELLFRRPLTLSVLCERRVYSPYGLKGKGRHSLLVFYGFVLCCEGGRDGAKGRNTLISSDGKEKSLPGKTTVHVRGSVSTCVSVLQHEHV